MPLTSSTSVAVDGSWPEQMRQIRIGLAFLGQDLGVKR